MIVSLDIPDVAANDIVEGVCAATGWTEASGKAKAQWAKEQLGAWLKDTAKRGLLMRQRANITSAIDPVTIS
jgi:hypothetical protein